VSGAVLDVAGLAALVAARPARAGVADGPGRTRIVAVDGRSGSGKTTLGKRLRDATGGVLVQLEDLYDGWDGLQAGIDLAARDVLGPLTVGRAGSYRRYDWHRRAYAERHEVPAGGTVVLEGVGACAAVLRPALALAVWVEAGAEIRRERAFGRTADGDAYVGHWDRWAGQEDVYLVRDRPQAHADVVLDGAATDVRADRLVLARTP
jgi:uridine kinase